MIARKWLGWVATGEAQGGWVGGWAVREVRWERRMVGHSPQGSGGEEWRLRG